MKLKFLSDEFTVCKVKDLKEISLDQPYYFIGRTDEEISIICPSKFTPSKVIDLESGWKLFKIEGVLDFKEIGIMAKISALLAREQISVLVVSTYNTDYFLIKKENEEKTKTILIENGYEI